MRGSSACTPPPTGGRRSKCGRKKPCLPRLRGSTRRSRGMGPSSNRAALAGTLLGVATFAVYMIGSNRSFGYDAAASFANFIATPSLWDAFAYRCVIPTIPVTQVATNDHVLASFISHVIFSATGPRSEAGYRLVPALAAGATVGAAAAA